MMEKWNGYCSIVYEGLENFIYGYWFKMIMLLYMTLLTQKMVLNFYEIFLALLCLVGSILNIQNFIRKENIQKMDSVGMLMSVITIIVVIIRMIVII